MSTIIQQGRFTSDGNDKNLVIRSDVDWMETLNLTIADADQTDAISTAWYWQRGMATGRGINYLKSNAANAANLIDYAAANGFTLVNTSDFSLGASTAFTVVSGATPPRVTVASTAALATGVIVRLFNPVGVQQFGGMDFHITVADGTHFDLTYAPTVVAGTAGNYRVVPYDPLFYPTRRFVTAVTAADPAVVTFSVPHGYTVGQKLRFTGFAAYGMTQMEGLTATITAVTASTVTTDIDSAAFTAFAFPLTAAAPFTPAIAVPFGEDTGQALTSGVNILGDATLNIGYIGMKLGGGATGPAGANNNVIYWRAGKSFSVNNE